MGHEQLDGNVFIGNPDTGEMTPLGWIDTGIVSVGHELEGQTLSEEALDSAERVLYGVTTSEEARKELEQKWKRNT